MSGLEVVWEGWGVSPPVVIFTVFVGAYVLLLQTYFRYREAARQISGVKEEADEEWEEVDEAEDAAPSDTIRPGPLGRLSAGWRSLGRFRLVLIFVVVAAFGGLTFWRRTDLGRWLGSGAPQASATEGERGPNGLTREGESYSVTLSGCRKTRLSTEDLVTCQFYVKNKTDTDYSLAIDADEAIAVDDLGIIHRPVEAQIGDNWTWKTRSSIVPGGARLVAGVIFRDSKRFNSSTLSLLRVSMRFAGTEYKLAFNDVKLEETAEGSSPAR